MLAPALVVALVAAVEWQTNPTPAPPAVATAWAEEVAGACDEASAAALRAEVAALVASAVPAPPPLPPPPPACSACTCRDAGEDREVVALLCHLLLSVLSPAWAVLAERRVEARPPVDPLVYAFFRQKATCGKRCCRADGPAGGDRLPAGSGSPSDGGRLCGFRECPGSAQLVELADGCWQEMEQRGQVVSDDPAQVELPSGKRVGSMSVFPVAAAPWPPPRLLGKRPLLEADGGDAADAGGSAVVGLDAGSPPPPPEGRAWVLAEPVPGLDIGTILEPRSEELIGAGEDATWLRRGRALRLEQMGPGEVLGWTARRVAELGRLLGVRVAVPPPALLPPAVSAEAAAPGSGGPALRAPVGAADGAEPAKGGGPAAVALGEAASDDARALSVEWDGQRGKFIELRKAVGESLSYGWGHQRSVFFDQVNLGGLACLEVIVRRLNAIVDAYKRGGAPSFANAKYLAPMGEADELLVQALRSHVTRRAKEDWKVDQSMKKAEAADARAGAASAGAAGGGASAAGAGGGGGKGLGRGGRGRGARVEFVSRALFGLEWMAGFMGAAASPSLGASTLDKHAVLQQRLLREAHRRRAAAPQVLPSAEAAIRELFLGQSVYETNSTPRNYVSFQPGKVSPPECVRSCRFLDDMGARSAVLIWEKTTSG
ncbi:unnamed protein product [Prorocentrum cordatum]|uniref:Uncharacterized protein n=1 Tax=Prorocentrum cordatum TaxID=2364126 RepID=A0ABN9WAV4_9DINO|nr:unnamed protein product [Polarella glacialis]